MLTYGHHEARSPIHGYEPSRDAAMQAFAMASGEVRRERVFPDPIILTRPPSGNTSTSVASTDVGGPGIDDTRGLSVIGRWNLRPSCDLPMRIPSSVSALAVGMREALVSDPGAFPRQSISSTFAPRAAWSTSRDSVG